MTSTAQTSTPPSAAPPGGVAPCSRRVMNLAHLVTQNARRFPDRAGFIWREKVWTWREIDAAVSALAVALALHGAVLLLLVEPVRYGGKQVILPAAVSASFVISLKAPVVAPVDVTKVMEAKEALPVLSAAEELTAMKKQRFKQSERAFEKNSESEPRKVPADVRQPSKVETGPKEAKETCIQPDEQQQHTGEAMPLPGSTGRVLCEQG